MKKKLIIFMIGAYSAWVTYGGIATANQFTKMNEGTMAAIEAATSGDSPKTSGPNLADPNWVELNGPALNGADPYGPVPNGVNPD